jgi:hypothetical protein
MLGETKFTSPSLIDSMAALSKISAIPQAFPVFSSIPTEVISPAL